MFLSWVLSFIFFQGFSSPQHGRDWRGGLLADRCASNGAGRVPRNPGKPFQNGTDLPSTAGAGA